MSQKGYSCSILVPVCNEAAMLPRTVPPLLRAAQSVDARTVWVCNGCSDNSATLIKQIGGGHAEVLEINPRLKTAALQVGDDYLGSLFPRFYVDADIHIEAQDMACLLEVLRTGVAELVSPLYRFDCSGASRMSKRVAMCWMSLPHASETAFHGVLGVSEAGRKRWEKWPVVLGDDAFVAASIPRGKMRLVSDATAISQPPKDFSGWVRMRRRWSVGLKQLRTVNLRPPTAHGQRRALASRILRGPDRLGACAFLAARLAAVLFARTSEGGGWSPER